MAGIALKDITDYDMYRNGLVDLYSLAKDGPIFSKGIHCDCAETEKLILEEDGDFYSMCKVCFEVKLTDLQIAEPDKGGLNEGC